MFLPQNPFSQLIILYFMNTDQCIQFIYSTTHSQNPNDFNELFNCNGDNDPFVAIENGCMNDIDEQSQPQESQSIDMLQRQSNSQSIPIGLHLSQPEDSLKIRGCQDEPNIPQCERQQNIGQNQVNPSNHQQVYFEDSINQRIQDIVLRERRKIKHQKNTNKKQINKTKGKNIKKRMKQQMKSLGQNIFNKFKKNVNMPKAIGRYLIAFHSQFKNSVFKDYVDEFAILSNKLKEKSEWIKQSKKNSFKLQHLKQFFSNEEGIRSSKLNRLLMRKIIQSHKREQIIENNQVKDKLEYLVSSKIFSLRCSNPSLASRMQMR